MWKKYKMLRGVMAVLAAVTSLALGKVPEEGIDIATYPAVAKPGYCTVLVYMNGSDLESDYGCGAMDLAEMTEALSKIESEKAIRVVVEAGGTAQWQYEPMKNISYGRFCLTKDMDEVQVEELEVRNMGRSDTLADFLNYGIGSYPAEHYGLICWDHGEGQIQGFGSDPNFGEDSLTLDEIRDAFESSVVSKPLDFVSMDACLMGNVELAAVLKGKTEYLIASEDLEPKEGHDYCWMEELAAEDTSEAYGKQIGNAIITTYQNSIKDADHGLTLCLSLVDMNAFDRFHNLFEEVIGEINSNFATAGDKKRLFEEIEKQRFWMLGFHHQDQSDLPEQVDLMDFIRILEDDYLEFYPDKDFITAKKEEIEEAYNQLVVETISQGYPRVPCGLSIYLPGVMREETEQEIAIYQKIGFCEIYSSFVEEYAEFLGREHRYNWDAPKIQKKQIILPLAEDERNHITNAYAAVIYQEKDGPPFFLFADGDVILDKRGYLQAGAETVFWGIKGEVLSLMEKEDSDSLTEYMSPVLYKEKGDTEWRYCKMYVDFSEENPDGDIRTILSVDKKEKIYSLKEGDQLIPLYPLYLGNEEESAEGAGSRIYENSYYMGEEIIIENLAAGDARLEMIANIDKNRLSYGFLICDENKNLYCSDMVDLK